MITLPRLLLVALCFGGACSTTHGFRTDNTGLYGSVIGPDGQPLPGIFVTAHRGLGSPTLTVLTDASGRYQVPWPASANTAPYFLKAWQTGYTPAERTIAAAAPVDFSLQRAASVYESVPSSSYLALLPDGIEKRQFILDCTGCHPFNRQIFEADGQRKSHAAWVQRTEQMLSFAGADTGFPIMSPSRKAAATAGWLVTHLGDDNAPRPHVTPPPPPDPAAAEVVITEYDYPGRLPHDLKVTPGGQVLITGMQTHQMHLLDPESGTFTAKPIPVSFANPRALDIDENGHWWILLGFPQKIAHYNPTDDVWIDYDIGMYPHSIVRAEDGRVWFNGHFTKDPERIGALDPSTGTVGSYDVPVASMPDGGSNIPYGLRMGPDGTLWGTQLTGGRLVRFNPATGAFQLYDLPTPFSGPRRLDVAPDGTIWIPAYAANRLVRFDPVAEAFTEYDLPWPDMLPYIVRYDAPRTVVWIATAAADAVVRFSPDSERFVVYPLPSRNALIRHMDLDATTGDLWVAYSPSPEDKPKIARLAFRNGITQ